jgi:hypothetical protein
MKLIPAAAAGEPTEAVGDGKIDAGLAWLTEIPLAP